MLGRAVCAVALCSWVASAAGKPAPAPAPEDPNAVQAKKLFEEGTSAYDLGDFDVAVAKYKEAYRLKREPVFLFNIGQSYRRSNNFEQAVFFYQSYLRNAPNAPNRADVERWIAELQKQIDAKKRSSTEPPTEAISPDGTPSRPRADVPSPTEAAEASGEGQEKVEPTPVVVDHGGGGRPIYKKWWFWAGIGAVAVTAVTVVAVSSGGGDGPPDTTLGDFTF